VGNQHPRNSKMNSKKSRQEYKSPILFNPRI
jgi:hypothetical protein